MASCPVCGKNNIFGEPVGDSSLISDIIFHDCPKCGAFRMDSMTEVIIVGMEKHFLSALFIWIAERNSAGVIPLIDENLIDRFHLSGSCGV